MLSFESRAQERLLFLIAKDSTHQSLLEQTNSSNTLIDSSALPLKIKTLRDQLEKKGFLNNVIDSIVHTDSTSFAYFDLGKQISVAKLRTNEYFPDQFRDFEVNRDTDEIELPFIQVPEFLESLAQFYADQGDPFARVSLKKISLRDSVLSADLFIQTTKVRKIDNIVIEGYPNVPEGFRKNSLGIEIGSDFNKKAIDLSYNAVNNIPFVNQIKPPEVLFTPDSTLVYYFLEKQKSNYFDGLVGFGSNETNGNLVFYGYVDLFLQNIFNAGESIKIHWQSNGEDRKEFKINTILPYVAKSKFTTKLGFELYRQDSTFSNVLFDLDLEYQLSVRSKLAGLLSYTNSNNLNSSVQNDSINSFQKLGYGISFSTEKMNLNRLNWYNYQVYLSGIFGNRDSDSRSQQQFEISLLTNKLWQINDRSFIFSQVQGKYLRSDTYFTNELYRIGGTETLRGFNEQSIFANLYGILNVEFRYRTSENDYFIALSDLGYLDNALLKNQTNTLSFGLGYSLMSKVGRINLIYALGKTQENSFDFNQSNMHLSILNNF